VTGGEPLTVVLGVGWLPRSEVVELVSSGVDVLDGTVLSETVLFDEVVAGLPLFPSDAHALVRAETTQNDWTVSDIRMTSLGIASAVYTRQGPKSPPAAPRPHRPKTCSDSGVTLDEC
jgi:hypothetical protein